MLALYPACTKNLSPRCGIPSGVTGVERHLWMQPHKPVLEGLLDRRTSGGGNCAGLPVSEPIGNMIIIDIGGGTTEVAVLSLRVRF